MRKQLENPFQTKVIEHLYKLDHCWDVKIISCNKPGSPDIIGCYAGLFFAIETKRPDGKGVTSPLQKHHKKGIKRAKGFAIITKSLDEVIKFMEKVHNEASRLEII